MAASNERMISSTDTSGLTRREWQPAPPLELQPAPFYRMKAGFSPSTIRQGVENEYQNTREFQAFMC